MSAMVASCSTESRIVIDVALEHRATLATALAAAWSAGEFEAFGLYRGCDDGWYGTAGPALAAETWLRAWTAAQGIKLEVVCGLCSALERCPVHGAKGSAR